MLIKPVHTHSLEFVYRPFLPEFFGQALELWKHIPGLGIGVGDDIPSLHRFADRNPGLSELVFSAAGPHVVCPDCERPQLAGSLLCGHDGRRAYIYHVAVLPQFRGHGLGRVLVEHCLKKLAGKGLGKVHLFCFADNADGHGFWDSLGFARRNDILVRSMDIKC